MTLPSAATELPIVERPGSGPHALREGRPRALSRVVQERSLNVVSVTVVVEALKP